MTKNLMMTSIYTNAVDLAKAVNRMIELDGKVKEKYGPEVSFLWKLEVVDGLGKDEKVVKLSYEYIDQDELEEV